MTRREAINRLVGGLSAMENGKEHPFPIPTDALIAIQQIDNSIVYDKSRYAMFVCAVILGKYDDELKDWK